MRIYFSLACSSFATVASSMILLGCVHYEEPGIYVSPGTMPPKHPRVSSEEGSMTNSGPGPAAFATKPNKELPAPSAEPNRVDPGPPGGPPSDAIVLFDGKDLSKWQGANGAEPKWEVKEGVATVNGTGTLSTKDSYGDCQFHIEWATPAEVKGEGQGRGNSGVYFQGRYEVQILDSFTNKTYYHGQAGSVYKQHAPLVNASRKPGEWQTYDIVFRAPRFDSAGKLNRPGTFTVLHNGVLVQDHVEILGTTSHEGRPKYSVHPSALPLSLQDHGNPIRFRNIWLRPLQQSPSLIYERFENSN